MSSLSIDAVWDETIVFLRRESALILPLAVSTFGIATILLGIGAEPVAVPVDANAIGLQVACTIPALFLTILGNMAISLMVLKNRLSVGEALRGAIARMPTAIALGLVIVAIAAGVFFLAVVIVTILAMIRPADLASRLNETAMIAMIPMIWLGIRLLVMWPVVAGSQKGPIEALRHSIRLTKGNAGRAFVATIIFGAVYISLTLISQIALTPAVRLAGLATGQTEIFTVIGELIVAFIGSVLMMGWTVFVAFACQLLSD